MTAYIYTVTTAALVVSILVSMAGQGTTGALIKMAAGLFMALMVISPLMKLELPDPEIWMGTYETEGRSAAASGQAMAEDALETIIKERTRAYILDKAARCGAALEVEVELDQKGIPASVTLIGKVSPGAKAALEQELAEELGLGKEVQHWTDAN